MQKKKRVMMEGGGEGLDHNMEHASERSCVIKHLRAAASAEQGHQRQAGSAVTFHLAGVDPQSLNVVRITKPHVHLDERFSSFQTQHVPWLWFGEQLTDRSLRQTKHCFAKQLLSEVVELQHFLHFACDQQSVQFMSHGRNLKHIRLHWGHQRGCTEGGVEIWRQWVHHMLLGFLESHLKGSLQLCLVIRTLGRGCGAAGGQCSGCACRAGRLTASRGARAEGSGS